MSMVSIELPVSRNQTTLHKRTKKSLPNAMLQPKMHKKAFATRALPRTSLKELIALFRHLAG